MGATSADHWLVCGSYLQGLQMNKMTSGSKNDFRRKHKTCWTEQTNDGKIVHEAQILDSEIGDPRLELDTN